MATNKNFGGLATRLGSVSKRVGVGVSAYKRRIVLAIEGELVKQTPVKSGRARANWILTNRMPTGTEQPLPVGTMSEAEERAYWSALSAKQVAENMAVQDETEVAMYLTNNVPYSEKLANGSSKQAPAGYVENAMLVGIRKTKKPTF